MHPAYLNIAQSIWVLFNSNPQGGWSEQCFLSIPCESVFTRTRLNFLHFGGFFPTTLRHFHTHLCIFRLFVWFNIRQVKENVSASFSSTLFHLYLLLTGRQGDGGAAHHVWVYTLLHTVSADSNLKLTLKRKLDKLRELWNPAVLYTVSVHKDYRGPR